MRLPHVLICLLLLTPNLAEARDLTPAESTALEQRVEAFNAAMSSNDYVGIVSVVPPGVIATLAQGNNMSADAFRAGLEAVMEETMASVTFVSFDMALDQARYEELPDGSPYAMIPTETVMDVDGQGMRATGDTLAMLDGGEWYLVRVSETAQVDILKQVYPAFAEVDFPAGTLEAID